MSSIYATRFWRKSYNWKTPHTINYPKTPAYYIIRDASVFEADKPAIDFYGALITFDQLYHKITRFANVLVEQGVKKGDRVGILLPNCPQFVIAYWAIMMAGAIVVNVNPLYTKDELKFIFQDSGLSCLITWDAIVPVVRPLCDELNISKCS